MLISCTSTTINTYTSNKARHYGHVVLVGQSVFFGIMAPAVAESIKKWCCANFLAEFITEFQTRCLVLKLCSQTKTLIYIVVYFRNDKPTINFIAPTKYGAFMTVLSSAGRPEYHCNGQNNKIKLETYHFYANLCCHSSFQKTRLRWKQHTESGQNQYSTYAIVRLPVVIGWLRGGCAGIWYEDNGGGYATIVGAGFLVFCIKWKLVSLITLLYH